MFRIAIIGRPNVGKSTLFNRLALRGRAIVDDRPGVTRDRREEAAALGDLSFMLMDTAGVEAETGDVGTIEDDMRSATIAAMGDADLLLMLYDARAGVTESDKAFALLARKSGKPVIALGNKCEGGKGGDGITEGHALGFGDPVAVSAAHGEGLDELHDAILSVGKNELLVGDASRNNMNHIDTDIDITEDDSGTAPPPPTLRIVVIGRPNTGKSTLINRLIGEERLLTGDMPGVTRDAIAIPFSHNGEDIILVDTAGMRRRSRITDKLEIAMVADARDAIRFAHVCILMMDAREEIHKQDLDIARHVADEGRGLVIAANMWDGVAGAARQKTLAELRYRLDKSLGQVAGLTLTPISALHGAGLDALMEAARTAYARWNIRIPTAALNRWLEAALEAHPPPLVSGRRLRIRYATQIKTRPPRFALFASKPDNLPDHYLRYLAAGLRETFGLDGIPLRLMLRKGGNPYV